MILNTLQAGEVEVVSRTFFPSDIGGGVSTVWKFLDWWDIYENRTVIITADSINSAIETLRWMERSGDVRKERREHRPDSHEVHQPAHEPGRNGGGGALEATEASDDARAEA